MLRVFGVPLTPDECRGPVATLVVEGTRDALSAAGRIQYGLEHDLYLVAVSTDERDAILSCLEDADGNLAELRGELAKENRWRNSLRYNELSAANKEAPMQYDYTANLAGGAEEHKFSSEVPLEVGDTVPIKGWRVMEIQDKGEATNWTTSDRPWPHVIRRVALPHAPWPISEGDVLELGGQGPIVLLRVVDLVETRRTHPIAAIVKVAPAPAVAAR